MPPDSLPSACAAPEGAGLTLIAHVLRDVRYGARQLLRAPSFSLAAIVSLAAGIAVSIAIFGVTNALLLRPLGRADAGELVRIGRSAPNGPGFRNLSYDEFAYIRANATTLDAVVGYQLESVNLGTGEAAEVVPVEVVSGNYFETLRIVPRIGRGFSSDEDRVRGAHAVAVISDSLWRALFSADPDVIGRTVRLNAHDFVVVGVAPEGFSGSFPGVDVKLWVPVMMADVVHPEPGRSDFQSLMLLARREHGAGSEAVRAQLDALAAEMARAGSGPERMPGLSVAPARGVHPAFAGVLGIFMTMLMASVTVVLLIACTNVAGLLLARAQARRGEFAARLALGAGRRRLIGQLLAESVVLATVGGATGLLLATWAMRLLETMSLPEGPGGAPLFVDLHMDTRVLLFSGGVSLATAVVFGLAPAVQGTRVDLAAVLRGAGGVVGHQRSGLRTVLLVFQTAASVVLLLLAVLLFRGLRHAEAADVGFQPERVVLASFNLQMPGYDRVRREAFHDDLARRVRLIPGVQNAAHADFVPMGGRGGSVRLQVDARQAAPDGGGTNTFYNRVTAGYFSTIGLPLVAGRAFVPGDAVEEGGVLMVNAAAARRFWPGEPAVGQRARLAEESADREVIGVTADSMYAAFGATIEPLVYLPADRSDGMVLHVRSSAGLNDLAAAIAGLARQIDGDVAPITIETMQERMASSLFAGHLASRAFAVTGAIAFVLAATGLYGVILFTLARRTAEIGLRIALGAGRIGVLRRVAGGALAAVSVGLLVGLALAAAASRLMVALLFGLDPLDPPTFVGVALLFFAVAATAAAAGARKGLRIDPMSALRTRP